MAKGTNMGLVVFVLICWMIVFRVFLLKKAGKPGLNSLRPILGMRQLHEIAGGEKVYACWKNFNMAALIWGATTVAYKVSGNEGVGILVTLGYVIGSLLCHIFLSVRLGLAFGKKGGFILGLIFLPPMFYAIMAFGKSSYIGLPKMPELKKGKKGKGAEIAADIAGNVVADVISDILF